MKKTILTRKENCPKCQGTMTMDIGIDGYPVNQGASPGLWICKCGNTIEQSQDDDDWI